jgi:predicted nicotinamide N-methyase
LAGDLSTTDRVAHQVRIDRANLAGSSQSMAESLTQPLPDQAILDAIDWTSSNPLVGAEPLTGALARDLPVRAEVWRWRIADRDVALVVPSPEVIAPGLSSGPNPYWTLVWEPALLLAGLLPRLSRQFDGTHAVELGCGLGLPGVVAAILGARVTFVDRAPAALAFIQASLVLNEIDDHRARFYAGGWGRLPAGPPFDLVLGSEIVYEPRSLPGLVRFFERRLSPTGLAYLIAEDRPSTRRFVKLLHQSELAVRARHDFVLPTHPDTSATFLVVGH